MVRVFKWWSENRIEKCLFVVQNVGYSNGPQSHMTLPFEYQTPIQSNIQMNLALRWLLYLFVGQQNPESVGQNVSVNFGKELIAISTSNGSFDRQADQVGQVLGAPFQDEGEQDPK